MKLSVIALALLTLAGCAAQNDCDSTQTISEIQGLGKQSSWLDKQVTTRAIVTAVLYPNSKNAALLVQSLREDEDKDNRTSEALLLTDEALVKAHKVGDVISITGTVSEQNGMTALSNASAKQCAVKASLPEAVTMTLPVKSKADWEAVEGMLVQLPQTLFVNDTYPLSRYGEVLLAEKRLWVATDVLPAGEEANAFEKQQRLSEIWLDDGSSKQNPDPILYPNKAGLSAKNTLRVGDSIQNLQAYVIETKQGYRLIPTTTPEFSQTNPRQEKPEDKAQGHLRVAAFNVLNFFTGETAENPFPTRRGASSAEELSRQQAKMIAALSAMDADVVGLLEVENNGTDERSAIATLVRELNKAFGHERYAFVNPKSPTGTDAIKVAIIYDQTKVKQVGEAASIATGPFAYGSRAPLAQTFSPLAGGESFTVSINHFKSKGSCPDDNKSPNANFGQGCWNPARVEAAQALHGWLASQPTGIHTANQLLIGDLNAYSKEDPLLELNKLGWQHLTPENDGKAHYSYVYQGRTGSLDHALASKALQQKVVKFQHWNINADEPASLDYNTEFKSDAQKSSLYAPDAFRSSDHDPVLIDFKF